MYMMGTDFFVIKVRLFFCVSKSSFAQFKAAMKPLLWKKYLRENIIDFGNRNLYILHKDIAIIVRKIK